MISKDEIDTTLTAYNYNNACANLKSKARDNHISEYILMRPKAVRAVLPTLSRESQFTLSRI
jgi:hypothetical protein